jgi:hypothetical protein
MGTTPAKVVIHARENLRLRGLRFCNQETVRVQDHSRGAEAALQRVVFDKGLLKGMELSALTESLNRDDVLPFNLSHRDLTGSESPLVDEDRAGSADSLSTPVLGPRETHVRPKDPEEFPLAIHFEPLRFMIQCELDGFDHS